MNLSAQDLGNLKKNKPLQISGNLGLGGMYTAAQGIEARRTPFSWYVNGSPTLNLYGITIPFSFVWSEQERSFSQPFNKYGASPYYKWAKLHLGYRNVYYSDYTLSGATFLGGGFDLKPGKFRLGAVYGKFRNKSVESNENRSRYSYLLPSYERWGYGVKVGYGKGPNTTDLIFFRAKDKVDNSVTPLADSVGIKPMENVAFGIKSKYTFLKKLDLDVDMAASLVTLDSRINDSSFSEEIPGVIGNFIKINQSTVPYLAGRIALSYSLKKARIKAEYKRVDPEYQSLGSFYINNDLEQYSLSTNINLFKNKVNVNGSYGIRTNNLLNDLHATSINKIASIFLAINPKPSYGISLNYSNYGTDLSSGQIQLNDSILFSMVNQSMGGNIRYTKSKMDVSHNIILNVQFQNLLDNNIITRQNTESESFITNLNYNYGQGKRGLSIGGGITYSNVKNYLTTFQLLGPSLHFRKKVKKKKVNFGVNSSYQIKINDNSQEGSIVNVGGNIGYTPFKKHTFSLSLNALFNNTSNSSIYSFNEQRVNLRYTYQL